MAGKLNSGAVQRVAARLEDVRKALSAADRRAVTVGIHQDLGAEVRDGGATLAEIGAFHEFGTSKMPRRSWLLDGISENEAAIGTAFKRVGVAIAARRMPVDRAYDQLGEFILAKLKARVRARIDPPNAPATIARKGSSVPLIDEARLLASMRAKVVAR